MPIETLYYDALARELAGHGCIFCPLGCTVPCSASLPCVTTTMRQQVTQVPAGSAGGW